ncbi:MAG TPA: malate synthase A [Gemmatimonadaceae bacterium]|nr:malate synthase A [Gemmatimonadaceae bacterium]
MALSTFEGIELTEEVPSEAAGALTADALQFVARLHRRFNPVREALLARRAERQVDLDAGESPGFLPETAHVRAGSWRVADAPAPLLNRRVEITGPVDRKMMINALNSGASVFMADFEDSLSPTWPNVAIGQANLMEAVRGTLTFDSPDGRSYRLNDKIATLVVRPRGWHLVEARVLVDGSPVSASLFDFGVYFFQNAHELMKRGNGWAPYFYLPKIESHLEARLWNDVFVAAQEMAGVPRGTIRATVLIETILAAFEMDEILYELREHSSGLNAGRWDYIFSMIKKFRNRPNMVLPDRGQVTMTVPFMRAYTQLLVKTCHKRGAHAIGGMSAFIPSRRDEAVNARALTQVREDKQREAGDGFDGSWVAHPDLVPVVREVFDGVLGDKPNQRERQRLDVPEDAAALLDARVPGGSVTGGGVRLNVSVALQYLESWLRGSGAVGINNLMEDTATAEISRAQLWQWIRNDVPVAGAPFTGDAYRATREAEVAALTRDRPDMTRLGDAARLLDDLVLGDAFAEFLTVPGARLLDRDGADHGATG